MSQTSAPDRSVPLLVAAGVLVVAVVATVLLFGVERPPDVEPVLAEPTFPVPASIAWFDEGDRDRCLRTAAPDGQVRDVTCDLDAQVLAWTDDGIVVREWSQGGDRLTVVDPTTGDRESMAPVDGVDLLASGNQEFPHNSYSDGRLTVRLEGVEGDQRERVLWEVAAPRSYEMVTAAPAPDGSVVAMGDNAGRLLVVPADGSSEPRRWLEDVPRYADYVWEGTPLPPPGELPG